LIKRVVAVFDRKDAIAVDGLEDVTLVVLTTRFDDGEVEANRSNFGCGQVGSVLLCREQASSVCSIGEHRRECKRIGAAEGE